MTHTIQLQPGWWPCWQQVCNLQSVFIEDLPVGECIAWLAEFFDGFFGLATDNVVCEYVHALPLHTHPQYRRRSAQ
ncbi:hypothetical protein [Serratia sp. JSRIV004]|uniref:hypothetical protein n=1 Tax=Serratia sp. JSRIV004 TaxID=2831895 RepID=UPI001CC1B7EA|nr:hypothetical protein [Serratia sp. JSRIV004]UAN59597.1 hypothetical protein KGP21_11330 [Serratia sp. JSRIV004]